jgi:hypothetical protein
MESFLLTLDIACVVLLLRNVLRVIKSEDPKDLGIFNYSESPSVIAQDKRRGVGKGA